MADEKPQTSEQEAGPAPATTLEELEQKLNELDQRLSKRIGDNHKDLTETVTDLSTKVGNAGNDLKKVMASVAANEGNIKAIGGTLDTLRGDVGKAKSAAEVVTKRVDQLEEFQGALNTALFQGLQEAKDFALEQGNAAKQHADKVAGQIDGKLTQAKTALEQRIAAVENAPVKPHKHTLHLTVEGETDTPLEGK